MAIYHLSSSVISRSQGRSAVASAAYRSGSELHDERYDKTHDYTRKTDVVHNEIFLPENVPQQFADRETLWNAVEASEKRKDAQLAREVQISLPRELTLEQQIALVRNFAQSQFVEKGMIVDLAIHYGETPSGEPQPHAHLLLTMRELTSEGFGQKVREWNAKENLLQWREAWAELTNHHLALNGHDIRIDHRSYAEQGIDLEPQSKIGSSVAYERMARQAEHQRIAFENGEKIAADPSIALDALIRQQSTFTRQDLARFVHRHTLDAEQFERVFLAVKSHESIVTLSSDDKGRERFTTQTMLDLEHNLLTKVGYLDINGGHRVEHAHRAAVLERHTLSLEQRDAFTHLVEGGNIKCLVGYAGSGKSYLLGAAGEAWEAQGFQVQGATLSGIAAENLQASSGIESRTVASLLYRWDQGDNLLTKKDILVIDEVGLLGTRQLERIVNEVERRGAKLALIGDPEQLQAIEAGAPFRAVLEQVGYLSLTDIRRQVEPWQQEATRWLATGETIKALTAYDKKGHLHEFVTQAEAQRALVERWQEMRFTHPEETQLMLTYLRKDVQELNSLARHQRHQQGELGDDHRVMTSRGARDFAVNDRVYFLQNDRSLGVMNGTLGTVTAIHDNRFTVQLDRASADQTIPQRLTFDLADYPHIDHGYAATIHKAQGVTVDRSFVLASRHFDRHTTYVALSRHRDSVDVFWSREAFSNERALYSTLYDARPKEMALDYYRLHQTVEKEPKEPIPASLDESTPPKPYQHDRESFRHDANRREQALERLQARQHGKLVEETKDELQERYGKPFKEELHTDKAGYYHKTVDIGDKRYALLEQDKHLVLVPYEKEMAPYRSSWVHVSMKYSPEKDRDIPCFKEARELNRELSRGREKDLDLEL